MHTPSFCLSGRLPLGSGSCQGRVICLYYEAVLAGEPADPWGEATVRSSWSWADICWGTFIPPTSNTRASGVWPGEQPVGPGEQPVGRPESLGLVGPYLRREVRACCRGWDHRGLWPAFWRPGARGWGKKGHWTEVASCVWFL